MGCPPINTCIDPNTGNASDARCANDQVCCPKGVPECNNVASGTCVTRVCDTTHQCGAGEVDLCYRGPCASSGLPEGSQCEGPTSCATDSLCAAGLSCRPLGDGTNRCQPASAPGSPCDNISVSGAGAVPLTACMTSGGASYFCPSSECARGGAPVCTQAIILANEFATPGCTGNFGDSTSCAQCEPGTRCVPSAGTRPSPNGGQPLVEPPKLCRQVCGSSADCLDQSNANHGCDAPPTCLGLTFTPDGIVSGPPTIDTGECYECAGLHAACNKDNPCCGIGQTCPTSPTGGGSCCVRPGNISTGAACQANADCCSLSVAGPNIHATCADPTGTGTRRCLFCGPTRAKCTTRTDGTNTCCSGLCQDGRCFAFPVGPPPTGSNGCQSDAQCAKGNCVNHSCVPLATPPTCGNQGAACSESVICCPESGLGCSPDGTSTAGSCYCADQSAGFHGAPPCTNAWPCCEPSGTCDTMTGTCRR